MIVDYLARVYVTPKPAVLDPQGRAVADSLHSLGFDEIGDVRLGKYIEVTLSGPSSEVVGERVDAMCRRLLANNVIEDFRFDVEYAAGSGASDNTNAQGQAR